jgi:hypothetical protein
MYISFRYIIKSYCHTQINPIPQTLNGNMLRDVVFFETLDSIILVTEIWKFKKLLSKILLIIFIYVLVSN